ncbi:hypothetical protein HZF05_11235 [Sphingomonas sp. CGMCC 1.13654]|uniref:Uncharacterized protein n=1 Tax=Sphingomonas chungangi TaxID=2683589 RepID=A0A838LB00_9SPHN|nr:hypothetical protein [Sphingomonas chungangi]MBA2934668.1 hypothetical protein [Sphingomonas chungangi]MVW57979.1 hypothetical protein [Sphingomonas chungangi]
MLRPTVGRMAVLGLLVSLVVAAGLWLAIGYGAFRVSHHIASQIDHLPHGPRPEKARIENKR